jgi:hypothetical protein
LVYTAGPYGIDDTGALKVVFRSIIDIGGFQTTTMTNPSMLPLGPATARHC